MPGMLGRIVATRSWVAVASCLLAVGPAVGQAPKEKPKEGATAKPAAAPKIDINRATAEEMIDALPGVGEATAAKIIAGRPYTSVEGLEKAGIPSRTIEAIRPMITFGGASTPKTKPAPPPAPGAGGRVDLNTATAEQLRELPGIGESTAAAIIAARPFRDVGDLEKVKGLGEAKAAALRDRVRVGPVAAAAVKAAAPPRPNPDGAPAAPVNLNTATRAQLEALPFIGPVKAQAIIDARPFKAKEDVMKVLGIKQGVFDRIKDSIRVD